MKFVVFSLGCKVNQYEGRSIIAELINRGHEATDSLGFADCYIINTCSVTMEADKKSRQAVARVLKLNPNAKVVVCGCSSQNDPKRYENKPNVTIISGTSEKMSLLDSIMSDIIAGNCVKEPPTEYEDVFTCELTKTRGYIKVQDGCNNFCSYCIIPYLRGRSRSRSLESIITEAREMANKTNEIVVTGINVSDYGANIELKLIDLIRAMKEIPVRKRFGSLECTVIDKELLLAMKESGFCDSFHLSLQSGSNSVLKRMNRKYTAEKFIETSDLIRSIFPLAGITTDVIVGFPGETEEEFCDTIKLCERVGFSGIHVFPYSVRRGTPAAKMEQINRGVALDRAARLRAKAEELRNSFLDKLYLTEADVYVEESIDGFGVGFTSNYVKVYANADEGEYVKCKLLGKYRDGVKGEKIWATVFFVKSTEGKSHLKKSTRTRTCLSSPI